MSPLPEEILQKALGCLPAQKLLNMCAKSKRLARLADNPGVWAGKVLIVQSSSELSKYLNQRNLLRHVRKLNLSNSYLSGTEIIKIFDMCHTIEHVELRCMDQHLDDCLVTELVQKHGRSLKSISLDRAYNLTNLSIQEICKYCSSLKSLSLHACMFSNSALMEIASSDLASRLHHLNIGRCHLIDLNGLRNEMLAFTKLRSLNISCNDSIGPVQLTDLMKSLPKLKRIDITDCVEICRKDVSLIQRIRPDLDVKHSSKLEDFSAASIRSYILSMQGYGQTSSVY